MILELELFIAAMKKPQPPITANSLIDLFNKKRPELVWRVGRGIARKVYCARDDDGRLLTKWDPVVGIKLLGCATELVDGYDLKLLVRTPDGLVEL